MADNTDPFYTPYEYCGHMVPGFWRFILPKEALAFQLPRERRATCNHCPMVRFNTHDALYRCCAYHPLMPGFLLGFALKDKIGKKAIINLFKKGYLNPEGYQRTPLQWVDYLADLSEEVDGEKARVKCPLIIEASGLCAVYPVRNAVCSTFFCLNDHGDVGNDFWEALEEMISQIEVALHQWALGEAGFDVKGYFQRLDKYHKNVDSVADKKTRGWHPKVLKKLWGSFYGREFELFKQCSEIISENRDKLWEIAEKQPILDSPNFERAMVKYVPKKYQDEIDPDDLDESEDTASLIELWNEVKKHYRALWKVPEKLVLNKRALIVPNPKNDKESKELGHLPFMVAYLKRRGGKSHEWREFVTGPQAKVLQSFQKETRSEILAKKRIKSIEDPTVFLAEWHAKKILQKPLED